MKLMQVYFRTRVVSRHFRKKKMLKAHLLNTTKTNKAARSKNNISDPMFDVIFILLMTPRTCKK